MLAIIICIIHIIDATMGAVCVDRRLWYMIWLVNYVFLAYSINMVLDMCFYVADSYIHVDSL